MGVSPHMLYPSFLFPYCPIPSLLNHALIHRFIHSFP